MDTLLPEQVVVSDGAALQSASTDALHPRDWVMAQTALSGATRDALSVLVAAYGGLQIRNGEFYILRSRVEPLLRTKFVTFKNYLTTLRKLGLLEIVSRGPNQYGPRTIWRMRLDVVLSASQLRMNFDEAPSEEIADIDARPQDPSPTPNSHSIELSPAPSSPATTTESPAHKHAPVPSGGGNRSESVDDRVRELERLTKSQEREIRRLRDNVKRLRLLLSGEDDIGHRDTSSSAETPPRAPVKGKAESLLEGQINALFKELDVRPLTGAQRERLLSMEAKWLSRWQKPVPKHFAEYAVAEAFKSGTDRFAGYVLGVLERSIKEGYTVQGAPDDATGQDFLRRTGNDSQRRKFGVRKSRY